MKNEIGHLKMKKTRWSVFHMKETVKFGKVDKVSFIY